MFKFQVSQHSDNIYYGYKLYTNIDFTVCFKAEPTNLSVLADVRYLIEVKLFVCKIRVLDVVSTVHRPLYVRTKRTARRRIPTVCSTDLASIV